MSYYNDEFEFELVQLTQEDIDDAIRNGFEDYLYNAKVGDWVYDDNEMLCSYSCVYQWYSTTPSDTDSHKRYAEICSELNRLNKTTSN